MSSSSSSTPQPHHIHPTTIVTTTSSTPPPPLPQRPTRVRLVYLAAVGSLVLISAPQGCVGRFLSPYRVRWVAEVRLIFIVAAEGAFGWLCSSQGVFGSAVMMRLIFIVAAEGAFGWLCSSQGVFGSAVMMRLGWLRNSHGAFGFK
ncbi:hypothetical protein Tco_1350022 [Tanacetum coccineum]